MNVPMSREGTTFASPDFIERIHVFANYVSCTLALMIGFCWTERIGYIIAASTGVVCLAGLLVSHALKVLIGDFYRQFQYREKFFLFLVHFAAMICPYFFFRLFVFGKPAAFTILFSILLVMLSFQAIDKFFFGRIHATQFALVLIVALYFRAVLNPALLFCWFGAFLFSIRYGHIAQRMEDHGIGTGVERWTTMRRGIVSIASVILCGVAAGWASTRWLPQHRFGFQAPQVDVAQYPFARVTEGQMLVRAFILFVLIVAILVLLKWIDSKLMRRKGTQLAVEADGAVIAKVFKVDSISEEPLQVEDVTGAREKILTAFRRFNERLQKIDQGRRENETVPAYFERLERAVKELQELQTAGSTAFDQACYGNEEPTVKDAEGFVKLLNDKLGSLKNTNE
ncbi:DUF4129 domain-containing protein [Candidatus Sumerlaeota bacterium]|nr:DUF4129 domain-containing protein [Candidatus Sumerlaeota bacterium]